MSLKKTGVKAAKDYGKYKDSQTTSSNIFHTVSPHLNVAVLLNFGTFRCAVYQRTTFTLNIETEEQRDSMNDWRDETSEI